jgi:(5-formylfuran-3-yl)methyl phosphate synthase
MSKFNANLLVSARSLAECEMVLNAGGCWLDLKEPMRGSLGRPDTELVHELVQWDVPNEVQVSIAGGELLDWSEELDHELAASLPTRFHLKLALAGIDQLRERADTSGHCVPWPKLADRISQALTHPSQLILVHYADANQANSPNWDEILRVSEQLHCKYVLVDTYDKKAGGLLDHCSIPQLRSMIGSAKGYGLSVALAGSLRLEQIDVLSQVGAEWLGFRGALCQEGDRKGILCPNRLQQALSLVSNFSRNAS